MGKVRSKHFKKPAAPAVEAENIEEPIYDNDDNQDQDMVERTKDATEEELEKLVFGDMAGFQAGLLAHEEISDSDDYAQRDDMVLGEEEEVAALEDSDLFFVDAGPTEKSVQISTNRESKHTDGSAQIHIASPAWEDSDDERLTISLNNNPRLRKLRTTEQDDVITGKEYTKRLRMQFERINPVPQWALPSKDKSKRRRRQSDSSASSASSSDDDIDMDVDVQPTESLASLLQTSQGYTRKSKPGKLKPETLDIQRLRDANHLSPAKSGIQSLDFHPTHPLLLSGGYDHVLRLNHIDGKTNPPATSLYLQSTAIHTALFHPDGKRVFASGRRRFFHIWDLESGKVEKISRIYGHAETQKSMESFKLSPDGQFMSLIGSKGMVNMLDAGTGQWIASAKVEGIVSDHAWASDGSQLTIANRGGEIWEWSTAERKFMSRWTDEGGIGTTKLALTDRWCAIGSQSGVVNIYDRKELLSNDVNTQTHPTPRKTLGNLVTSINVLEFSQDGQILCMASRGKADALRMVHLPTCTVFKNWPTSSTPLGKVSTAAFANGLFAAGNEQGKIRLWEIR